MIKLILKILDLLALIILKLQTKKSNKRISFRTRKLPIIGDKNIAGDSKKEVETIFLTIPNENLIKNK